MADIEDVSDALVSLIAGVIYPNGTGQAAITGLPTLIYAGWPQSSQLDADMAGFTNGKGGRIHVTMFPTATEKNSTRYFTDYQQGSAPTPSISLSVSGQTVTLAGTVSTPQNVGLIVSNAAYTYAVQAGDTLATVAAALAAQITGATSSGAVITLPATSTVTAARSGTAATVQRLTRTTQRTMQITVWADTPDHRKATAKAIDNALSGTEWLSLADGTGGRVIYVASHIDDMVQKANLYRRDLMYSVEYSTTQSANATEVIVTQENDSITGPDGNAVQASTLYQ
jgi:hypothetical protein